MPGTQGPGDGDDVPHLGAALPRAGGQGHAQGQAPGPGQGCQPRQDFLWTRQANC